MSLLKKFKTIFLLISVMFVLLILLCFFLHQEDKTNVSSNEKSDLDQQVSQKRQTYNFLIMGQDDAANLCDVIMIASYNSEDKKIDVLQIPRDTYASYTKNSYRKLNGAVYFLGGPSEFASFIELNLGIKIDYYITTDMETIALAVDKLGGVEIDIQKDLFYSDPYQDLFINLKAGKNILNGDEVIQFLRYRAGYLQGDIGRIDAQKIFLASVMKKILDESNIYDIINIALSIIDRVDTNITPAICTKLVWDVYNIELGNISFMTLPGEDVKTSMGTWYYVINKEQAFETIKHYFAPELSYETFDKDRLFTSLYQKEFNIIYDAVGKYKLERYTADKICQNGINIK